MKQNLIIAVIAIGAFLLGTLMPRTPIVQEEVVTKVERDTIIHTQIKSVPVYTEHRDTTYIHVSSLDTVWVKDTMWIGLPRQHYFAETDDVKIWHSGIDSRIDSLVNFREKQVITKTYEEPWKRNSFAIHGETGYYSDFRLSVGATYRYNVSKWLSVSANAGYDLYIKQPYATARLEINMFSW